MIRHSPSGAEALSCVSRMPDQSSGPLPGAEALSRVFRMPDRSSGSLPGAEALSCVFRMPDRSSGPLPGADVLDGSWHLFLSGVETGTPRRSLTRRAG